MIKSDQKSLKIIIPRFNLNPSKINTLYSRHGQTAARQTFFSAPEANFKTPFCKKIPWICLFLALIWVKLFYVRPAELFIFWIWPVSKKVWPPLLYSNGSQMGSCWETLFHRITPWLNLTFQQKMTIEVMHFLTMLTRRFF